MKKLFVCADQYLKESDWKNLALVKFCLCAVGIMIGLMVPKGKKKYPFLIALTVFIISYIPLMIKFIRIAVEYFSTSNEKA
ncbi:MAG: permease of phosphate ABC transporter [Lachnospiraceae bacterium]|nr:permease of phosphate ABC transporter [Lachnospiraceae bacterium]